MAIEVCRWEVGSSGSSPRNSCSYDLDTTAGGVRLDSTLVDSSSEIEFCFGSSCSLQELSPADELFLDGKILPVQIKKDESFQSTLNFGVQRSASLSPPSSSSSSSSSSSCSSSSSLGAPGKKIRIKDLLLNHESDLDKKPKGLFMQFKRSISVNYDKSRSGKGLIRSLHFLSRSNSTGSVPNPNSNLLAKESRHLPKTNNHPKHTSHLRRSSSLSASMPYHSKKPQARNSFGNGNGGICVSPVLNFPPPAFISNVADGFFRIGSLCNSKNNMKTRL